MSWSGARDVPVVCLNDDIRVDKGERCARGFHLAHSGLVRPEEESVHVRQFHLRTAVILAFAMACADLFSQVFWLLA